MSGIRDDADPDSSRAFSKQRQAQDGAGAGGVGAIFHADAAVVKRGGFADKAETEAGAFAAGVGASLSPQRVDQFIDLRPQQLHVIRRRRIVGENRINPWDGRDAGHSGDGWHKTLMRPHETQKF